MGFNKFTIYSFALFLLASFANPGSSSAQITVTAGSTATALATSLVGPGVTISSPVLTCSPLANGTFTVTPGTLIGTGGTAWGINSGVILATGRASSAPGLESTLSNTTLGTAGDAALTALAGATTHDACILEFDIIPTGDTIKFHYIFGSEEYNHSTCSNYNDAFAFFISGPGITGTPNIALIPGTTIPVTVNSVNNGIPGTGYTLANCTAMGAGSPFTTLYDDNTGGTRFTMKGFTKMMTALHDVIPCNTYHLKLTIADASNGGYDSEVFIEQGSISSSTTVNSVSVCSGSSTVLTATPAGGTWTSSDATIATIDPTSGIATGLSAGTANMTYTTGAGCYKITALTVSAPPVIGTPTSTCVSTSVTLSATPAGGTWTGGMAGIATVTTAGYATGIGVGVAPITYTSVTGCVATGYFSVVNLAPITGPDTICVGSPVTLSNPTPGGAWSSSAPAQATIDATTGVVTGVASGTTVITYSFGGACYSAKNILVNPVPAPPAVTDVQYCLNQPAVALIATGNDLLWYNNLTGGIGTTVVPIPVTNTPGLAFWYISQTIGSCESPRATLTITIHPEVSFSIAGDTSACPFDTLSLSATGLTIASPVYNWILTPALNLLPGSTLTSGNINAVVTANTDQYIYLHITDAVTGCTGDDTALIHLNIPPLAAAFTPENACLGDTVSLGLSGHSDNAYTYNWTVDGLPLNSTTVLSVIAHNSNSGGPYVISWLDSGAHIISVQTMQQNGGCASRTSYDTVKVHALPDAAFTFRSFQSTPCINDSVFFSARTDVYGYNYAWTPSHSFYDRSGPLVWATMEQASTDVALTVTDPFGCSARTNFVINTDGCCKVSFPTAFTPNNDGKNDLFRPIFADQGRATSGAPTVDLPSYHNFHTFRIENRWGQTVFETTNNYPQWDGTFHGAPQDMGVYYYVLTFDCNGKTLTEKGDVTLVR